MLILVYQEIMRLAEFMQIYNGIMVTILFMIVTHSMERMLMGRG